MSGKLPSIGGDYVRAVEAMRAAQRAYFKYRTQRWLDEAKRLERLVDSMTQGYNDQISQATALGGQMSMTDPQAPYEVRNDSEKE